MGTEDGWIKLHRKLLSSACNESEIVLKVWVNMLLLANWERRQLLNGDYLEPGQLIIGQEKFASQMKMSRRNVRTALKTLQKLGNVTSKPTSRGTLITICNWRTYQSDDLRSDQRSDQQVTSKRPASDQQVTNGRPASDQQVTSKRPQNKKGRKEEGKKGRKEEGKKERNNNATSSQCDSVISHYRSYHEKARPGEKERKLICQRLSEGYSVEDLKLAIDGCHVSPFHCGENERGRKYQALELIVRDSKHVADFMEAVDSQDGAVISEKTRRSIRAGQRLLARFDERGIA